MSNVNWNDYTVIEDPSGKPAAPAAAPAVDWSQYEPIEDAKPGFMATVKRSCRHMRTTAATTA